MRFLPFLGQDRKKIEKCAILVMWRCAELTKAVYHFSEKQTKLVKKERCDMLRGLFLCITTERQRGIQETAAVGTACAESK